MSESSKTRTGRVLQVPTPEDDAAITAAAQGDLDAMPFTDAEWARVKPLARRGRPLGSGTKTQITLRLDADLVNEFKATGPSQASPPNAGHLRPLLDHLAKGD